MAGSSCSYIKLLESWNCGGNIIKIFKENEIDDESFILLSDQDIREMIPLVGPRTKFMKNYKAYLDSIKSKGTEVCPSPVRADNIQPNKWIAATVLPEGALILDTYKDDDEVIEVDSIPLKEEITPDRQDHLPVKRLKLISEATSSGRENSCPVSPESDRCLRISRPTDLQQSASVSGLFKETRLFPNGLRAHLATNYEGRLALKSGTNLNNTSRTYLVRSVVDYLFKYFSFNNKINTQIFRKAAAEICEAYPNERASVYFLPAKPKTKFSERTFNNGKLFNRYQKVQRKLGGAVIEYETDCADSVENLKDIDLRPAENSTTAYEYLQHNVGTYEVQKENWRLCSSERAEFLRSNYIFEYIKLFPVLRMQFGYKLLLQDFDEKYSAKTNALYTVWKHLASAVLKFGIMRTHLSGTVREESRDFVVVKYFPTIFHPGTVRNKATNKNFRPSSAELGETFFLHVRKLAELDYEIGRRTNIVSERGDTLQPFIIAIGSTFETIESIYVYVDGMRYLMDNIVQAVDVCFKVYQALNAAYPITGQQIWSFIQRYVYNIHHCTDVEGASQAEVAVDLCFQEPILKEYLWDGSRASASRRQ